MSTKELCRRALRESRLPGGRDRANDLMRQAEEGAKTAHDYRFCARTWLRLSERERARACWEKADQLADGMRQIIMCARGYLELFRDGEAAVRCLEAAERQAQEGTKTASDYRCCALACLRLGKQERARAWWEKADQRARTIKQIVTCARGYMNHFQDREAAVRCLETAERRAANPLWFVKLAEAWTHVMHDHVRAAACLSKADPLPRVEAVRPPLRDGSQGWVELNTPDTIQRIGCGKDDKDILNDDQAVRRRVARAQEQENSQRAAEQLAKGASGWLRCARSWQERPEETRRCLREAQRRARTFRDLLACASACKELLNDLAATRRCLSRSEKRAKGARDWRECARQWHVLLEDAQSVERCFGRAEEHATGWYELLICAEAREKAGSSAQKVLSRLKAAIDTIRSGDEAQTCAQDCEQWLHDDQLTQYCWERVAIAANRHLPGEWRKLSIGGAEQEVRLLKRWHLRRSLRLRKGNTQAELARYYTSENRVLFYPACGFDWGALYLFQKCDVFIYCDNGESARDFAKQVDFGHPEREYTRERLSIVDITEVPQQFVDELSQPLEPPEHARFGDAVAPWGRLVHLQRHVGEGPPLIRLWYFGIGGATLCNNLFNVRNVAPEYFCIKQNGANFGDYEERLGRLVKGNQRKPKFVIYNEGYNWPWNVLWRTIENWRGTRVNIDHRPGTQPTQREEKLLYLE